MPAHPDDYRVERDPDGSLRVHFHGGQVATLKNRNVMVDLTLIESVGIKHLAEVESHTVNTFAGSRSHVVRFINGGLLQFAYNNAGDLIELRSRKLICELSHENEMLFYLPSATEPAGVSVKA